MDEDAIAVILQAERIIYRAGWRLLEETALAGLTSTRGLRRARLWVAVPQPGGRPVGSYRSAQEAAEALARVCGKLSRSIPGSQKTTAVEIVQHDSAGEAERVWKLVLLRHAKSAWPAGVPDHDRPLGRRGRRDAPAVGRWVRLAGLAPDHVLCSTARRARETWDLAQRELGVRLPVAFEPAVYAASAGSLLDLIRQLPPAARTVVVVGHDPGLPDLALALAGKTAAHDGREAGPVLSAHDRMAAKFPTGAVAVLEFSGPWSKLAAGRARLASFVTPGEMHDMQRLLP